MNSYIYQVMLTVLIDINGSYTNKVEEKIRFKAAIWNQSQSKWESSRHLTDVLKIGDG